MLPPRQPRQHGAKKGLSAAHGHVGRCRHAQGEGSIEAGALARVTGRSLGIDETRREKLRLRYHELETGQIAPARVDRRVWAALADTLKAHAEDLAAWTQPFGKPAARVAYYRAEPAPEASFALRAAHEEPRDEVDELFGLGRSAP